MTAVGCDRWQVHDAHLRRLLGHYVDVNTIWTCHMFVQASGIALCTCRAGMRCHRCCRELLIHEKPTNLTHLQSAIRYPDDLHCYDQRGPASSEIGLWRCLRHVDGCHSEHMGVHYLTLRHHACATRDLELHGVHDIAAAGVGERKCYLLRPPGSARRALHRTRCMCFDRNIA